ncbi:MAG: hypothetical protein ACOYNZ_09255 [Rhodoferax sp.]
MQQTSQPAQALPTVAHAAGRTCQLVLGLPFDLAREQYAEAVRIGFIEQSMLGNARFERTLSTLEKLTLGPWARQV